MKKVFYTLLSCIMMSSMSLCFTACGDDDEPTPAAEEAKKDEGQKQEEQKPAETDKLKSEWSGFYFNSETDMGMINIIFNEDGTGSYGTEFDEEYNFVQIPFTYVYTAKDNKLVITTAAGEKVWYFINKGDGTGSLEADGHTYEMIDLNAQQPEEGGDEEAASPFEEQITPDPENPIVGIWMGMDEENLCNSLVIRPDGTCRYTIFDEEGGYDIDVEMEWTKGTQPNTYICTMQGTSVTVTINENGNAIIYGEDLKMERYED